MRALTSWNSLRALADKVSAEFKDGVLSVHLPKDETAKPKSIEVKVQ